MLDLSFPDCADFSMDEWNQKIALEEVKVKAGEYYKRPGQCGPELMLANYETLLPIHEISLMS